MAKKPKARRRDAFFGQQVIRLMTKTCLANDLGHCAFALLAIVSAQQDAARGRPVTYWNEQLMAIAAIRDERTLRRVRQACMDAGWLEYENRGPRKAGLYRVVIPARFADLNDSRCDEGSPTTLGALDARINGQALGASNAPGHVPDHAPNDVPDHAPDHAPPPSSPSSSPSNKTPTPFDSDSEDLGAFVGYPMAFQVVWDSWPKFRLSRKVRACKAWRSAIAGLSLRFDKDARKAEDWLHARALAYCRSPTGRSEFCLGIVTWLEDGGYDDPDEAWAANGERPAAAPAEPVNTFPPQRKPQ